MYRARFSIEAFSRGMDQELDGANAWGGIAVPYGGVQDPEEPSPLSIHLPEGKSQAIAESSSEMAEKMGEIIGEAEPDLRNRKINALEKALTGTLCPGLPSGSGRENGRLAGPADPAVREGHGVGRASPSADPAGETV